LHGKHKERIQEHYLENKNKDLQSSCQLVTTQHSRDYRQLSRPYLTQKRAVAIHQSLQSALTKSAGGFPARW